MRNSNNHGTSCNLVAIFFHLGCGYAKKRKKEEKRSVLPGPNPKPYTTCPLDTLKDQCSILSIVCKHKRAYTHKAYSYCDPE